MARSLSLSPERREEVGRKRGRSRSRSPRGDSSRREKKAKKSHKRSRSPKRDHKHKDRKKEKEKSPLKEPEPEEGELPSEDPVQNGNEHEPLSEEKAAANGNGDIGHEGRHRSKSKDVLDPEKSQHRRSDSRDRKRSKSRNRPETYSKEPTPSKRRHRSKSRERRRSPSLEKHRSKSRRRSPSRRRSASRDRRRPSSKDRRRSPSKHRRHTSKSPDKQRSQLSERPREASTAPSKSEQEQPQSNSTVKQPLSLEEVLKKKKEEEEALAKPKFLTKKEREQLALERLKQRRETGSSGASETVGKHNPFGSSNGGSAAQRREDRRAEEDRDRKKRDRDTTDREKEKELELIKLQYLGAEKVKKKVRKASEKFHLNFDWETTDDTSKDLNPLYNSTHEAALAFGTGRRAGVDVQTQKQKAVEHRNLLQKKARAAQGLEETEDDRRRDRQRQRQAAMYDDQTNKNAVKEHWKSKSREEMTDRDWRIFREDFSISYKGVNVTGEALPYRNWEEAPLPEELMKSIKELGYKKPSPIQMASIPLGLLQRDIIGVAETGSGKTAAFVLPMLCYIKRKPIMTEEVATLGPYAVIMAPVRELAQQIEEETMKLAKHTSYRTVSIVGGQDIGEQGFKLRKGCEIVVATPGRLKDCLDQAYAVLHQCAYVVLDEADRMIEMGFLEQVTAVLDAMPSTNMKPEGDDEALDQSGDYRTTYMFSATMPPPVERLARKYMRRPAVINIGSAGKATDNVTQKVYLVKENEKLSYLEKELNAINEKRTIVFVNTKKACDIVSRRLDDLGYSCTMLHGSKTQDQREASLAGFREEKFNVLVATDVAGRGIDVPDVALVINYDMPNAIEHYTHRIGRTARAGRTGTAITFLTPTDTDMYYDLKKFLEDSKAAVPSQLMYHEAAKRPPDAEKSKRETTIFARK